jgi:hypothetical protein
VPRQIIDTESSKPAYHRRLAIRWIVAIVLIVIIAFVAFELWRSSHHAAAVGLMGLPCTGKPVPGNAARLSNLGLLSYWRTYAA